MKRLLGMLVSLLGVVYTVAGVFFLSTGNPGGMTLGLLFLGGAALFYLLFSLQRQLMQMQELLSYLAIKSRSTAPGNPHEGRPHAPQLEHENHLEPAAGAAVVSGD